MAPYIVHMVDRACRLAMSVWSIQRTALVSGGMGKVGVWEKISQRLPQGMTGLGSGSHSRSPRSHAQPWDFTVHLPSIQFSLALSTSHYPFIDVRLQGSPAPGAHT